MPVGTVKMRAENKSILGLADIIQYKGSKKILGKALHIHANGIADSTERLFLAQYQRTGCSTMLTVDAKAGCMTGVELSAGEYLSADYLLCF